MSKVENIIEELKSLTLLEASELVQKIEQTFNVDTSVGGGVMMLPTTSEAAPVVEEKTGCDVVLDQVLVPADKKIPFLKVVRTITGLGLKEAKELVDTAPKVIQAAVTKDAAETAKKQLEEVGAVIVIK